jgi:mono/diheme cytochrome c family protein
MERVTSEERFRAIREAGRGVVYNDFSRRGASGAQYNVVHAASCGWLARSNLAVAKLWFEDLPAATDWLVRERGREGQGWKRCGTCHGAGASGATPRALPPSLRTPAARPRPDAPFAYRVDADPGGSRVEAWSSSRLPFEPAGPMLAFRDELRRAVAQLSAGPEEALYALYTSRVDGHFDVENVLLYNVGPRAFASAAANEIVVERALGPVPVPPPALVGADHHYCYEIVAGQGPWRGWSVGRPLASFGPLDLGPLSRVGRPASVWHALRRSGTQVSDPVHDPSRFGLDLVLEIPANLRVNLVAITKPLVDGVIAAFHAHDDPASLDLVASRVAAELGAPVDEIRALLCEDRTAILGARRLLWPRGDGVQWNPADDRSHAFRIRRVTKTATTARSDGLVLQGSLVEIEPRRRTVAYG